MHIPINKTITDIIFRYFNADFVEYYKRCNKAYVRESKTFTNETFGVKDCKRPTGERIKSPSITEGG